jgi:hypothetical protein
MIALEECTRFKPSNGDKCFTPTLSAPMEINQWTWHDSVSDHITFNQGLVFRTRGQAMKFHKAYRELIIRLHGEPNVG